MDRVALIAGASGAIGSACAELFAQNGWAVGAHYHRNQKAAEALCAGISASGGRARAFCADLTRPGEAERLASLCACHLGPPDALVYCAGEASAAPFLDTPDEVFTDMYALHVLGAVRLCRAALPGMIDAGGGSVVLFSSMWGQIGAACEAPYAAAKGAVIALTQSLAKELAVYGVRVNCVAPGLIDSPMNAAYSKEDLRPIVENTPLSRAGTPREAARCAYFLAAEADFVTGQVLAPNGGFVV